MHNKISHLHRGWLCKVNGDSAHQEIPCCYATQCSSRGSRLTLSSSQFKQLHILITHFTKINLNIILASMPKPSKLSLPMKYTNLNLISIS
jgi:hypothetical protein